MKKLFFSFIAALFYISCSSDGNEPASSVSLVENEQAMIPDKNGEAEKPYTGSSKIYLADMLDGEIIEETMLEVGNMSNGKITLALPTSIDSHFLMKMEFAPDGLNVEPLGVEILPYTDPLRLFSNGKHIGNLKYVKIEKDGTEHNVSYWYFSKDTRINGRIQAISGVVYKVEAKKGWNKVYMKINVNDISGYYTTDLSEVPDGLAWIVSEK